MMLVLSKGIVKTAAWGLMWRVTLGAVLSLGDLVTDLIKETFTGEEGEEEEEGGSNEVAIRLLTTLTVVLGSSLILLVGLFFTLINGEYRHTFFSIETAGQITRRNFLDGTDVMKSEVFTNNESHWAPIRDKVETWVKAGTKLNM
ncbi:hypothetical protein TrLO_g11949 [Triparma laevis f. longispina]|uniref:Uncharacterized protein n=1 Tax=Triparma laevis f. longispina TaxID=1714387 RepID=A0A9W7FQL5_9STRA|nr:hypothetical protein TrLO_g11949 [Triparma laevis f. longispina]